MTYDGGAGQLMEWRPAADIDVSTPRAMEDLGVPEALVHDIVLRVALAMGRTTTLQLCTKLALSPGLMTKVVEDLRDLQFIEIQGMDGRDYRLATTGAGRQQANDRMQLSRYVGPVPVTLAAYSNVIRRQHANPRINLAALKAAFSDLVISETYFVLRHHYEVPHAKAVSALRHLLADPRLHATGVAPDVLRRMTGADVAPGLMDRLIHGDYHSGGATLLTFDKDAARLSRSKLLTD